MTLIYQKEILEKKVLPQALGLINKLREQNYFKTRFFTAEKKRIFINVIHQDYQNFENDSEIAIAMDVLDAEITNNDAMWHILQVYLKNTEDNQTSTLDTLLKEKILNYTQLVTNRIEQKRISLINSQRVSTDKEKSAKVLEMLANNQVLLLKDANTGKFTKIVTVEDLKEMKTSQPRTPFEAFNPFASNNNPAEKLNLNSAYLLERIKQNQLFNYTHALNKSGYKIEEITPQDQDKSRFLIKSINPETGKKKYLRVKLSLQYKVKPQAQVYSEVESVWSGAIYNSAQLTMHLGQSSPKYQEGRLTQKPSRLTEKTTDVTKSAKINLTFTGQSKADQAQRVKEAMLRAKPTTSVRMAPRPQVGPNLAGSKITANPSTVSDAKAKTGAEADKYDQDQTLMQKKRQHQEAMRQKQAVKKPTKSKESPQASATKNAITGKLTKWMGISSGSVFGVLFDPTGLVDDFIPFNPFNLFDIF